MSPVAVLRQFLEMPLWTSEPVLARFRTLQGAIYRESGQHPRERFVYIPGFQRNRVVLVAHADTFFDENYGEARIVHQIIEEDGYFKGSGPSPTGADDRAGCAMLWALKDFGHSILVADGEEIGLVGSNWLMEHNPDIAKSLNSHCFMLEFDRKNGRDYKCYHVGTNEFRTFIEDNTGYTEPELRSSTDISVLCKEITGVNLSVGYYDEHTLFERVNIGEWMHTYEIAKKLLVQKLPRFSLLP